MAPPEKSRPAKPGKMVLFTADAAPSLDESGMMDSPVFMEPGVDPGAFSGEFAQRSMEASRLTVPFRQEGPGGFSLVTVEFGPGYLLPRHSHNSDCLYYIVEGELVMGNRTLGAGDGFFLPADQPYAYRAGPQGVKLLEFRHQAAFDIKVWEKDMARFRERAEASFDAAERGEA
jgi:quercetin dioxygenase-like cupin family protein